MSALVFLPFPRGGCEMEKMREREIEGERNRRERVRVRVWSCCVWVCLSVRVTERIRQNPFIKRDASLTPFDRYVSHLLIFFIHGIRDNVSNN